MRLDSKPATTAAMLALSADNQRQIVEAFRGLRATTRGAARRLAELGLNDSQALKRMVASAILRKAGPDRYFLDEGVWATRRNLPGGKILRIALVLVLVVVAAAIYAATR